MKSAWCAALAVAMCSAAWARTPDGDGDEKKDGVKASDVTRVKSLEELNAELQAQKAELDAQRTQIQALQAKSAAMSLDGPGAIPEPQDKTKSAVPEDVKSKWNMTIYGFVEADFIEDSKQSAGLVEAAGNPALPIGRSYAADHGQLTYGARNSRLGVNVAAPEYAGIRASMKAEMDFLGNGTPTSEQNNFWTSPVMRIRHMYLTLDTEYVTVTLGQSWELFGWQPYFFPNTVDVQGVPDQVYSRSPKIQISHVFKGPINLEPGVSLSRPVERGSNEPDIQAGLRLTIPDWVGVHTMSATSQAVDAAGIGVSGCYRDFRVPRPGTPAVDADSISTHGKGVCLDLFLPLLHPDAQSKANSLSFTGEIVYGAGINDLYTGFSGGLNNIAAANVVTGIGDQGPIGYLGTELKAVQWRTEIAGLQYYLPPDGNWWISLNYGSDKSNNIGKLAGTNGTVFAPNIVFDRSQWLNASLSWSVTPAVILGLSVDQYRDSFVNEQTSRDTRVQFSAFYVF
jgi:hypothetical protein